ncbi:MAG: hypothetical protein A2V87_00240 [Deltaproteobacteria bacterium RBG_16_58_17]|nr:MAG: hypothetical protein A2V87_00240 [Deltaproteobacteria bacterium RBG_16_58_17]OHE21524.1 MAG: hypothetical protein A2X95_02925 [Syntrophobacterales bacterium GWF2_56_9]
MDQKMDLLEELKKLSLKLDQAGIDYALCGGLAIAIYAKPRATLDIDIMIDPAFLSKTKKATQELGFTLSSAPMEFQDGAVKIHRLTKIDKDSGEHLVLDLLMVTPETKKAWDDRLTVEWEGDPLKVVSPQGLILLKSLRSSGQDQDDIEYLRSLENED